MICKQPPSYSDRKKEPTCLRRWALPLEMSYTRLNLLRFTDVPELLAQVPTGPANDIHLPVVLIVANGALPLAFIVDDDLSVKSTHLAVIALGVELSVLDVVVDELDNGLQGFQVLGHIGNLGIGDASAAGDGLELILKTQLGEGVNVLPHINVVAVGVVAFVGHIRDISKPLPVNAGEPVAQGLGRCAVKGEPDISLLLPVIAGLAEPLHDAHSELRSDGVGVADALHDLGGLIQADVAQGDGRVAAIQQGLNGCALGQTGDSAILPVDGTAVRSYLLQRFMPTHQSIKAQLQALFQDGPELVLITVGQKSNLGQVEGHNTLVDLWIS